VVLAVSLGCIGKRYWFGSGLACSVTRAGISPRLRKARSLNLSVMGDSEIGRLIRRYVLDFGKHAHRYESHTAVLSMNTF